MTRLATVQISGYKFSGLGDCHRFIHEETTHQRFDTFYDMISLLHRFGAPSVTMSKTLKEQDELARAGHSSKILAVIVSSFQTKIPACLAKEGTASTATVPIPGLPNVEMWGLSSRDGARKSISSSVSSIVLNFQVHHTNGRGPAHGPTCGQRGARRLSRALGRSVPLFDWHFPLAGKLRSFHSGIPCTELVLGLSDRVLCLGHFACHACFGRRLEPSS